MAHISDDATYALDPDLQAAVREARACGDQAAEAAAQLVLDIRRHEHFRALVLRMTGITIALTPRYLAHTQKTTLLGQPEPDSDLAHATDLARLIVADLGLPTKERDDAVALALVLAEECSHPAPGRRRARLPV